MDIQNIIQIIEDKRKQARLPMITFCRMAGVKRGSYYNFIAGDNVTVETLVKMLAVIGLRIEDLIQAENEAYLNGERITRHSELLKRVECWEMIETLWKGGMPLGDIEVAFEMPRGTLSKKLLKEQEKDLYKIKMMI